jgi:hypothetical protein
MTGPPDGKLDGLVIALATGCKVADWCKANNVPTRTAYHWANKPRVKARVQAVRDRLLDRAIGRLTRHAVSAVETLARVIKPASTATTPEKISAAKAILASLIDVRSHVELSERLTALEELARENAATDAVYNRFRGGRP